jgi:hypothetical protein
MAALPARLAGRGRKKIRSIAMNLRQVIQTGVIASAVAHASVLALLVLFSEVHPFSAVTAEPIAVDIVTAQQVENKPELVEPPKPTLDLSALQKPVADGAAAPAPQLPTSIATPPQKQATPAESRPGRPQPAASPAPAYVPPQPDLSIKYHVLLGLPPDISAAPSSAVPPSGDRPGDNFDAPADKAADVASSLVAEFRRHLKTCSKLPASLTASDDVKVTLRLFMTPAGRLAAEPVLIEASASLKGPLLMQSAIKALEACQPYAMLPADRYGEWKVIDLSFTPRDFAS